MRFSAFATFGFLKFSAGKPTSEVVYDALSSNLGEPFAATDGTVGAEKYATAMAIARGQESLLRAGDQTRLAKTAPELLKVREFEYGVVSSPRATYDERIAALLAKRQVPLGARRSNVEAQLRAAIGDAFLALRATHDDEIVNSPSTLDGTVGSWGNVAIARKLWKLDTAVTSTGSKTVSYSAPTGAAYSEKILKGDKVVLVVADSGLRETVTVTAADQTNKTFTATFTNPHASGQLIRVGRLPIWTGNGRHYLVIVTAAGSVDAETRRKVHEVMRKVTRSTSTWAIVPGESDAESGTLGPFRVNQGKLGITPIGQIDYP